MFERYTESARRALFFARFEASELGGASIETEHLLLGLLRSDQGVTRTLFARVQVSYEPVRATFSASPGNKTPTSVEIPFSEETKRVLRHAMEESDRLGHSYIGTEHLLLGVLREERPIAGTLLSRYGMRLDDAREQLLAALESLAAPVEEQLINVVARTEPTPKGPSMSREAVLAVARNLLGSA